MSCRRSVLAALRRFSVLGLDQIIDMVLAKRPWVRRGTIARVLDVLEDEGKVEVVHMSGLVSYRSLKRRSFV